MKEDGRRKEIDGMGARQSYKLRAWRGTRAGGGEDKQGRKGETGIAALNAC